MKRKRLRTGFTTGTAAAAAAKGAVLAILEERPPAAVEVELLTGERIGIPIHSCRRCGNGSALCTVIKDAGDDPDVTNGAEIGARVWRREPAGGEDIILVGGDGVGRVTKPGLPVAVGEPAINPVPRRMIRRGLRQVWQEIGSGEPLALTVEIFVPRGQELARQCEQALGEVELRLEELRPVVGEGDSESVPFDQPGE